MNLDVWHRMERHLGFLNDHDIGVHMFLGFEGARNGGPAWAKLGEKEKDFYVRYVVSRIGPYANLAGWNFVWEVEGDRESHELGLARLLAKYDVFNHLRTYEDENPREHHYDKDVYTFAAVENHRIVATDKGPERVNYWRTAWTHHMACLLSYARKPVYMSEGNALWRRYWHEKSGANQDDLRQSAWACATAGASFNWNGHAKEYELYSDGPIGLPFNDANPYTRSEAYVDLIAQVMNHEVEFYKMSPDDDQLTGHDPFRVYALVDTGRQYLVFAMRGESFALRLAKGRYTNNVWIDTKTGRQTKINPVSGRGSTGDPVHFDPPSRTTDWVLILRAGSNP
jgi:hypothetical protein